MKALEILKNIDKIRDREYSIAFKDGWNSFSNENKQNCDFTIRHKEVVKLTNDDFISKAIAEIESFKKDNQRFKILFDSEFCRCSKCGEYKRSGFGCYCENDNEPN